ncbi:hypothetical protein Sjap_026323 [Stephania japonica]|uniref:Aminotransferase-like plant mobile domain-containing protein n=1 Tax=Stephania japonica TaxID=461633 RepID=A0AAP0E6T2_9MAGN
MTITLENIWVLLSIPVIGKTVVVPLKDRKAVTTIVTSLLVVSMIDVDEEIRTRFGITVCLTWLKDLFSVLKEGDEEPNGKGALDVYPSPEFLVRAYLLCLLGTTLFSNESSTRVSLSLLQLLEQVDKIGSYAWEATTLAFMYYQLGIASRTKVTQSYGYMTLLEVIRNTSLKGAPPSHAIAFYHGPMKYVDIVKTYNPIRVLRQMKYVQCITREPYQLINYERSSLA